MKEDNIFEEMHRNNISSWLSYDLDLILNIYSKKFFDLIKAINTGYLETYEEGNRNDPIYSLPDALNYSPSKYNFYFGTTFLCIYIYIYITLAHYTCLDIRIHKDFVSSEKVKNEIKKINNIIELDYSLIPNNSLFLIFGDHGIIGEKGKYGGNRGHGGKSKEELEAGFIAMTKEKGFTFQQLTQGNIPLSEKGVELWKKVERKIEGIGKFLNRSQFNQVDIVPSMARMFKFPIPNGNLGMIIPEIMNYHYLDKDSKNIISNSFYHLFFDHLLNFLQIYNFLEKTHEKQKDSELHAICEEFKLKMEYIENKLRYLLPDRGRIFQFELNFQEKEGVLQEALIEEFIIFVEICFDLVMKMRDSMEPMHEFFHHRWNYLNAPLFYLSIAAIGINIAIILYFLYIPSNNIQHYIQSKGSFICSFFGLILIIVPLIPVIILDNYYTLYLIYVFALFTPFYLKLYHCCTWINVKLFIEKHKPLQTPILGIIGTFSMFYLATSPYLFKRKSNYIYILYNYRSYFTWLVWYNQFTCTF